MFREGLGIEAFKLKRYFERPLRLSARCSQLAPHSCETDTLSVTLGFDSPAVHSYFFVRNTLTGYPFDPIIPIVERCRKPVEAYQIFLEQTFLFLFNQRNFPNGGDCHEIVFLPFYTGRCNPGAGNRLVACILGKDCHYHRFSYFDSDEFLL
jgi:hypothetical protein